MPPRTTFSRVSTPVLYLGPDRVAWLGIDGETLIEHFADHDVVDVLDSVAAMLAGNQIRRRPCIVALGAGFVRRKQIELPMALSGRELTAVLNRKAQELASISGGVVFSALPLAGHVQLQRKATQPWRVYAIDLEWATQTGVSLRELGIEARRVVVAELVGATSATHQADNTGTVAVTFLGDTVSISLLVGDGLVDTLAIPIHGLDGDGLASSLVQELRNLDSSWRRLSEGSHVGRVEFLGFCGTWRDRIEPAARMILPDVELTFHSAVDLEGQTGSLANVLPHAQKSNSLVPELGVRLPYAKFATASLAVVCTLMMVLSAGEMQKVTSAFIGTYKTQIAENQEAATVADELRAQIVEVESTRNEFAAEWNALLGTTQANLPIRELVSEAVSATTGHSALESLEFSTQRGITEFRMSAATLASTLHASMAMAQTLEAYRVKGVYDDIYLEPESLIATDATGDSVVPILRFTVEGTWSASR